MTMIREADIDATLAGYTTGLTAQDWMDYARRLEKDNKALVALGNKLNVELREKATAYDVLNVAAETEATRLESQITRWKLAAYSMAVVFIGVIGGLVMGIAG